MARRSTFSPFLALVVLVAAAAAALLAASPALAGLPLATITGNNNNNNNKDDNDSGSNDCQEYLGYARTGVVPRDDCKAETWTKVRNCLALSGATQAQQDAAVATLVAYCAQITG